MTPQAKPSTEELPPPLTLSQSLRLLARWVTTHPLESLLLLASAATMVYFFGFYYAFRNGLETTALWASRAWNSENNQEHSWLILPITAFLLWYHREALRAAPKQPSNLGLLFLVAGVGLCCTGIAMAYALPHLPWLARHVDRRDHAASAQIAFRVNSFIALAIVERLAGPTGLALIAVLIGVCVPLLNVGAVWPMARHGQRGLLGELLRNPLVLATTGGLAANAMGFAMPSWLEPTTGRVGAATLALGLMAAGAGLQMGAMSQGKVLAAALLIIRHLLLPLTAWGLSKLLALGSDQSTVLLVFSSMPTAASAYVLAARMGFNGAYVAGLITLSTLLGMLSLPFALGVLRTL